MILSILLSLFFFIIVIVILVSVHEFGHFITAKWAGAYVERFSIGMGPIIWKKKLGETEYCLSLIPVGGYVKILGEDPEEADYTNPRNLQSKSFLQRLTVFAAGSVNNIILAVIVVAFAYMIGIQMPRYLTLEPVIYWVAPGSSAESAGLTAEDRVLSVNGVSVGTWQDFMENIGINPKGTIKLEIERKNEILALDLKPEEIKEIGLGVVSVMHMLEPAVHNVIKDRPAEKAGIRKGDIITEIDGQKISHWNDISLIIRSNENSMPMAIKVQRDGEYIDFELETDLINGVPGIGIERAPDELTVVSYSIPTAVKESIKKCREWILLTGRFLGNLFTNRASVRSVGGPIMIAGVSGEIGKAMLRDRFGASQFLMFLGFISLQLGFINLLPLPVLDGGHILFLFFEKVFGRDRIKKAKVLSQTIGVILLIALALLVFINDIIRIFATAN